MWNLGDGEREGKREEERKYRADVTYEVWRSGRNPDRVDDDRVSEHMWRGDPAEEAARHEVRLQRQAEERRQEEKDLEDEQLRQEERRWLEEQAARADEENRQEATKTEDSKEAPF